MKITELKNIIPETKYCMGQTQQQDSDEEKEKANSKRDT